MYGFFFRYIAIKCKSNTIKCVFEKVHMIPQTTVRLQSLKKYILSNFLLLLILKKGNITLTVLCKTSQNQT